MDIVCHRGLSYFGVGDAFTKWMEIFLQNRSIKVVFDGVSRQLFPIDAWMRFVFCLVSDLRKWFAESLKIKFLVI